MTLKLNVMRVLRNPWCWDEATLEWARKEAALQNPNYCPHGYDECGDGCGYPSRCGKFRSGE